MAAELCSTGRDNECEDREEEHGEGRGECHEYGRSPCPQLSLGFSSRVIRILNPCFYFENPTARNHMRKEQKSLLNRERVHARLPLGNWNVRGVVVPEENKGKQHSIFLFCP